MPRAHELRQRRDALLARCAAERSTLAGEAGSVLAMAHGLDDRLQRVRRFVTQPAFLMLVLAGAVLLGRSRSLRLTGKTLGSAAAAWRAGRLAFAAVRRLRAAAPASTSAGAIPARKVAMENSDVG